MFKDLNWRQVLLAATYLAAGILFVAAIFQISPSDLRLPAVYIAMGMLLLLMAGQFLTTGAGSALSRPSILLASSAVGAGAIVYALAQITPAGAARQLVAFGGAGVAV